MDCGGCWQHLDLVVFSATSPCMSHMLASSFIILLEIFIVCCSWNAEVVVFYLKRRSQSQELCTGTSLLFIDLNTVTI